MFCEFRDRVGVVAKKSEPKRMHPSQESSCHKQLFRVWFLLRSLLLKYNLAGLEWAAMSSPNRPDSLLTQDAELFTTGRTQVMNPTVVCGTIHTTHKQRKFAVNILACPVWMGPLAVELEHLPPLSMWALISSISCCEGLIPGTDRIHAPTSAEKILPSMS